MAGIVRICAAAAALVLLFVPAIWNEFPLLQVSDEFAAPLCRTHRRQLHRSGNEAEWWQAVSRDINRSKLQSDCGSGYAMGGADRDCISGLFKTNGVGALVGA